MDDAFQKARARGVEYGQITDILIIRDRVFRRDISFSERVVLTALVKGDKDMKARILADLLPEHFGMAFFAPLFQWIESSLRPDGAVDVAELYGQAEDFVRSQWDSEKSGYSVEQVLPGFMAMIDHVLAIDTPDVETVDSAISLIHEAYAWRKAHLKSARRG